jgi:hypothetical protein
MRKVWIVPPLPDQMGKCGRVKPQQQSAERKNLPQHGPRRLIGDRRVRNWLLSLQHLAQEISLYLT